MFKGLFKKTKYITVGTVGTKAEEKNPELEKETETVNQKPIIPNGMWRKCNSCNQIIYNEDLKQNQMVCTNCSNHFRLGAKERLEITIDEGSFKELNEGLKSKNPLEFEGYDNKLSSLKEKLNVNDAIITGYCTIGSNPCIIGIMDGNFIMGSMGSVVGEKLSRAFEIATDENLPVIIFTVSGGARMQEGIFSLMQMAKVSAAVSRHSEKGLLYTAVLTDPTTGGVTASFAMQGDIIIAEKGAQIGFAGRRVIEDTIRQKLPEGFQSAEFLLKHGFLDMVCHRRDIRNVLIDILNIHSKNYNSKDDDEVIKYAAPNKSKKNYKKQDLTAYERVQIARSPQRPTTKDFADKLCSSFLELHGDRYYSDDEAIIGGIGFLGGIPVTIIGHQKGKNIEENIRRNFGMAKPEGYRKAMRLMKQAEKFRRPVICFVDTPGAYCGIEAEERGQGEAIAESLLVLSSLKTPVISLIVGEGGSGGALALALADEVWMMENAVYSVLSPEGFASILWKDASRAEEAAEKMKITASNLKEFGIIDKIIEEPMDGIHIDFDVIAENVKTKLISTMLMYLAVDDNKLLSDRYNKFKSMGVFEE
ncbi:acetyl-CoA carboxylase carboxyl transferase subunit [Clostridium cylindrosporum]|uniref:Multifunctional fusion protein n=1 Tax=Clostridium cylindrosporum DSM 605 TaxID=1121307 RepID=A0A0J8G690_CLOCY|nr:acetyl-CoA carboxylase carboxyl transferase subunit [Clostridium cylindrosporum]KMT23131.1 acetyl-coenzyme A carboxylase carboxyl transferase subunits beta/alpha [Clostridium cylindrosporum DSM 605]